MSRTTPPSAHRRLATGLVAITAAAGLSACGASLDAQTYQERIQEGSTDRAVGVLAIRNVAVEPPRRGDLYEKGGDAPLRISVVNASQEPDVLLEASSPAAEEVVVLADGQQEGELEIPPLGSTRDVAYLELRDLTRDLRTGEYIELTLRFEQAGTTEMLVPVALTGESDRPVYTGEGEEGHEPALQAPAGGHGEDEADSNEGVVEGADEAH